ncbi:MAG: hypothetical protein HOO67_07210 [Candidatus Peribacteraceae bacterium]|nr:hypothetical protein [Candidatus Peribacteraceae bacterium]
MKKYLPFLVIAVVLIVGVTLVSTNVLASIPWMTPWRIQHQAATSSSSSVASSSWNAAGMVRETVSASASSVPDALPRATTRHMSSSSAY